MKKGEIAKANLIQTAATLFWKYGYHATGINEILKEAKVSKGSFYFYFNGKEDLARATIDFYEEKVITLLKTAATESPTWEDFVKAFTSAMERYAKRKHNYGCPFAALGMELAFSSPNLTNAFGKSLEKIRQLFCDVLRKSDCQDVDNLSKRCLPCYEGHLLLYRMNKNPVQFKALCEDLIFIIQ